MGSMDPNDLPQIRLIREEQARLHQMVRELDARVEELGRSVEAPAIPPHRAEPPLPPLRLAAPEPSPPRRAAMSQPPPLPPPAGVARDEIPGGGQRAADAVAGPAPEVATPSPRLGSDGAMPSAPQPPPLPSLELRVGTYWMARIGIVILLTGLVFLGNYAYHRIIPLLDAWGKLALLAHWASPRSASRW